MHCKNNAVPQFEYKGMHATESLMHIKTFTLRLLFWFQLEKVKLASCLLLGIRLVALFVVVYLYKFDLAYLKQ